MLNTIHRPDFRPKGNAMALPVAGAGSTFNTGPVLTYRRSAASAVAGVVALPVLVGVTLGAGLAGVKANVVPTTVGITYFYWLGLPLSEFDSLSPGVVLSVCDVLILTAAWSWRLRTDVTAQGLVIRSPLSVRRVPWTDVSGLDQAPNGRTWALLRSGRAVTLPVVRPGDLHQIRAVAAGSTTAARPTVVTRGGWGIAVIFLACFLAVSLATWSATIQRSALMYNFRVPVAGGWPYTFLYRCFGCSGHGWMDGRFTPGWFLLDAAILGALPAWPSESSPTAAAGSWSPVVRS